MTKKKILLGAAIGLALLVALATAAHLAHMHMQGGSHAHGTHAAE